MKLTVLRSRKRLLPILFILLGVLAALLASVTPASAVAANQFAWPVTGHVPANDVAWHRAHENGARAVDIGASTGTSVHAAQSGIVVTVSTGCANSNSWGCGHGFGNYVIIRHDRSGVANPLYTLYAHLHSGAMTVSTGNSVNTGTKLGEIALSGSTTGGHVHFAIGTCSTPWSAGSWTYDTNCTIWNGADTVNGNVTAGTAMPGTYAQLVAVVEEPEAEETPSQVISGDFTGDGRVDMLALYRRTDGSTNVWVLPGTASGSLGAPVHQFALDWEWASIKPAGAGDVNNDGHADAFLVTKRSNGSTNVWQLPGTSTGVGSPVLQVALLDWLWAGVK